MKVDISKLLYNITFRKIIMCMLILSVVLISKLMYNISEDIRVVFINLISITFVISFFAFYIGNKYGGIVEPIEIKSNTDILFQHARKLVLSYIAFCFSILLFILNALLTTVTVLAIIEVGEFNFPLHEIFFVISIFGFLLISIAFLVLSFNGIVNNRNKYRAYKFNMDNPTRNLTKWAEA